MDNILTMLSSQDISWAEASGGYVSLCLPDSFVDVSDFFSDTSLPCLTRIAENTSMPPSMLDQLALHSDPSVREAVADNLNTPIDTLWLLSRDECADVRYAIAENHNVPLAILSSLRDDENPYVACRAKTTMERLMGGTLIQIDCWNSVEQKESRCS